MLHRMFRFLPPETAHRAAVRAAALLPAGRPIATPSLRTVLAGLDLPVPIGMAAGFDKNAEAFDGLGRMGFGFVEIGSVTPKPQPGNPRPRVFRLDEDHAVINRMGFNNDGLDAVARRLERRSPKGPVLGANVGANKDSADPVDDYRLGVRRLHDLVDYLVLNVSSPNTPGLRLLQKQDALKRLVAEVRAVRDQVASGGRTRPFFVKVAPDLDQADEEAIARVLVEEGADGLIVSNTTVARPAGLRSPFRGETGGLSGAPLFAPSTALLARFRQKLPELPMIGVGGVDSVERAYEKFRAGADAIQLYSGLVSEGPGLVRRLRRGLADRLKAEGIPLLRDIVGTGVPASD
ncbi:MAG TPA: quinone-dependent dihydroorotate dehydrogenase [Geminicoccus sp.]|jgi:dihydroorotate dehydrogenase|uniref:quinone-dependent dihydroorotate dehydrogenase n=1 Tax=Geminicoccus sp. TaxID=2024832 RepID=UPI002E374B05|nr:quinone-dependent dihydroorotate dehydrogenase [Geminicoccus sp.]HEX2527185.1 quinone-dependent dihydroorotate dehydrogenase [Geminicoccus sp.]